MNTTKAGGSLNVRYFQSRRESYQMKHPAEFWRGVKDGFPMGVAASVFAMVFGTVASDKGLSFLEGTLLSAAVYAGASQFTAMQFWQEPLSYFTIILVVFAINFRHVLYGASLGRKLGNFSTLQRVIAFFFLVDPNFALSEKRYEEGEGVAGDPGLTPSYYFGLAVILYPFWIVFTMVGLAFGNLIENPKVYGLDFVLPIYFLILLIGFRARANWIWVVLSSTVATFAALQVFGSPWHISCGAFVGVISGAVLAGKGKSQSEQG